VGKEQSLHFTVYKDDMQYNKNDLLSVGYEKENVPEYHAHQVKAPQEPTSSSHSFFQLISMISSLLAWCIPLGEPSQRGCSSLLRKRADTRQRLQEAHGGRYYYHVEVEAEVTSKSLSSTLFCRKLEMVYGWLSKFLQNYGRVVTWTPWEFNDERFWKSLSDN